MRLKDMHRRSLSNVVTLCDICDKVHQKIKILVLEKNKRRLELSLCVNKVSQSHAFLSLVHPRSGSRMVFWLSASLSPLFHSLVTVHTCSLLISRVFNLYAPFYQSAHNIPGSKFPTSFTSIN